MTDINTIYFPIIDSTNTWAKAHAHLLERNKITLVTANSQTKGRGRFNRQWNSPPDQNIYASYCFFVPIHQPNLFNIAQILSLSAVQTLNEYEVYPQLKWPNDLILSGKKLGGVLCETVSVDNSLCVVAGIGLNINMTKEDSEQINQPATSLYIETGNKTETKNILNGLSNHFEKNLHILLHNGFSSFFEEYNKRLLHAPGKRLRFHANGLIIDGVFNSLNLDGSLNLLFDSGEIVKFYAGEIESPKL